MFSMSKRLAVVASAVIAMGGVAVVAPSAHAAGSGSHARAAQLAPVTVDGAVARYPYGKAGLLKIAVSRDTAGGTTEVYDDQGVLLGTATMTDGRGSLVLAPKLFLPGEHQLRLDYLGDGFFEPATHLETFTVLKAKPTARLRLADTIDKSVGGKARVRVTAPDDIAVRGRVRVTVMGTGKSVVGRLVDGKVVLTLPKFTSVGNFRIKARYLGSSLLRPDSDIEAVRVVK
jgi:large repetitive protein